MRFDDGSPRVVGGFRVPEATTDGSLALAYVPAPRRSRSSIGREYRAHEARLETAHREQLRMDLLQTMVRASFVAAAVIAAVMVLAK